MCLLNDEDSETYYNHYGLLQRTLVLDQIFTQG